MSGSYHLWELATSRDEVYELTRQVVDELGLGESQPFRQRSWGETTQALLYGLHHALWAGPKVTDVSRPPYTHRTTSRTISDVVQELVPSADRRYCNEVASEALVIMQANLLARRVGAARYTSYLIREWPQGFTPRWSRRGDEAWLSTRDELDVQRQERRADRLAGEVTVSHDITLIPLPKPDPDSVMDYLRKVIPIAKLIQQENVELRAKLNELQQHRWHDVTDELDELWK